MAAYASTAYRLASVPARARTVVSWAERQLGKPYQWGAAGPGSFDCCDAVSAKKSSGDAKETLEVVDVAQLLARSVHIGTPADDDGDGGADGTSGGGVRVGTARSGDSRFSPPSSS